MKGEVEPITVVGDREHIREDFSLCVHEEAVMLVLCDVNTAADHSDTSQKDFDAAVSHWTPYTCILAATQTVWRYLTDQHFCKELWSESLLNRLAIEKPHRSTASLAVYHTHFPVR